VKAHNFRELNVRKESMSLVKQIYVLTSMLPQNEKYGLVSQINRCAVSIPSNIAEGSGRTTEKDFARFLSISLSSSYELKTQLLLVKDIFNIDNMALMSKLSDIQKMIGGFKSKILS